MRSELVSTPDNLTDEANGVPDLPPEYCRYRDEGCEFAQSCLTCPFPQCVYDRPRGKQQWLKKLRDKEITRLYSDGGKDVRELAQIFGISQRTIQRALKSSASRSSQCKGELGDE